MRHVLTLAHDEARKSYPRVFDFEGVTNELQEPRLVKHFRQIVTSEKVLGYLEVDKQAELAGHLKQKVVDDRLELTGSYIRENTLDMLTNVKRYEKRKSREVKNESANVKMYHYMRKFSRYARQLAISANEMTELWDKEHKNVDFTPSGEMRRAIDITKKMVDKIHEHVWLNIGGSDQHMTVEQMDDTIKVLERRIQELKHIRQYDVSDEVGYLNKRNKLKRKLNLASTQKTHT